MTILPINPNPAMRAYTHHLNVNAIISHEDVHNDLLAKIKIESKLACLEYYETKINNNTEFVQEESEISVYAKKYIPQEECCLFRRCDKHDDLIIKVNFQKNSRRWGIIYLFVQNIHDEKSNTAFINQADLKFGRFCNDMLLVDYSGTKKFPMAMTSGCVYWLRVRVRKEYLTSYISHNGKEWIEINKSILKSKNNNNYNIGVSFDLNECDHHDWLFSNYVQLYLNTDSIAISKIPIDYLISPIKNYSPYTFNPLLNYIPIRKNVVNSLEISLSCFIVVQLKNNLKTSKACKNT